MEERQDLSDQEQFKRIKLLLGDVPFKRLTSSSVTVVGIGAVGGYALEAIARAGVMNITVIDHDIISQSNINRQLLASHETIGQKKVVAAKNRIAEINPHAKVTALDMFVGRDTVPEILKIKTDLIIDAIDSLNPKFELLKATLTSDLPIISSMGAAMRTDPTKVKFGMLKDTRNCPLAKMLRKRFAKYKIKPAIPCVYSDEVIDKDNMPLSAPDGTEPPQTSAGRIRNAMGSLPTVTGIFGLYIANYAIEMLSGYKNHEND